MRIIVRLLLLWALNAEAIEDDPKSRMGRYREDLAKEFMLLSSVSYCDDEESIKNWTCKPCRHLEDYTLFEMTVGFTPDRIKTKALFVVNDAKQRVVVAFEGTHDYF